jgi:hypothetical protein
LQAYQQLFLRQPFCRDFFGHNDDGKCAAYAVGQHRRQYYDYLCRHQRDLYRNACEWRQQPGLPMEEKWR